MASGKGLAAAMVAALALGAAMGAPAQTDRPFRMGFSTFTHGSGKMARTEMKHFLRRHGDLVLVHIQGVPWAEAASGKPFPEDTLFWWEEERRVAGPGQKVYLALSPLNTTRTGIAENLSGEEKALGALPPEFEGKAFDDPLVKEAYLNYCRRAIEFFDPDFVALGVEVNHLHSTAPESWDAYVALHKHVYQAIKQEQPELPLMATFTLDSAHGLSEPDEGMMDAYAQLMPYNDIIGLSFYPFFRNLAPREDEILAWIDETFGKYNKPMAIAETGQRAEPGKVELGGGTISYEGSPELQAAYYEKFLRLAQEKNYAFVTLFFYKDYDARVQESDTPIPPVWQDCGLLDENNRRRPSYWVWQKYFDMPLRDTLGQHAGQPASIYPDALTCEHLEDPMGIDAVQPRLSWKLRSARPDEKGQGQSAYQILVAESADLLQEGDGLWDSGKVVSTESLNIAYAGKALEAGQRCWWKLRVWDEADRPSEWSTPACWSMGLMGEDWGAEWISGDVDVPQEPMPPARWGYRSANADNPNVEKWVQVDLGEAKPVEAVKLWPAHPFDPLSSLPPIVFPLQFRIEGAMTEDFANPVLLYQQEGDANPPAEGPLELKVDQAEARFVRITATKLGKEEFAGATNYGMAFAQIEVLSDGKNVAAGQPVSVLDKVDNAAMFAPEFVTDSDIVSKEALAAYRVRPPQYLRKEFQVAQAPTRATAYVTALGMYELRINGERVGDQHLAPQSTAYNKRVLYQTYDVTDLVESGENAVGAVLADGWYRSRTGWGMGKGFFGKNWGDGIARLLVRIDIEHADGSVEQVVSNADWKSTMDGPLREVTMYDGIQYDTSKAMPDWDKAGFDDSGWKAATVSAPGWNPAVVAQVNQPIRIIDELRPVAVSEPKPGMYIFDFGQNFGGVVEVDLDAPAGTELKLRYAEGLLEDGTLFRGNLAGSDAQDTYTIGEGGLHGYLPGYHYHGFRFMEVTGLEERPSPAAFRGWVLSSDVPQRGAFESSEPRLTKLWENILWTYHANLVSIVTDVSGRDERWGWMGDGQSSWQTLCYFHDMNAFARKWLQDMIDSQSDAGFFPIFSPSLPGSLAPGWSDAAVIISWKTYINYADREILALIYEPAKKYVEAVLKDNPNHLWEKNRGNDFGDWLDAQRVSLGEEWKDFDYSIPSIEKDLFATAYWQQSVGMVAQMAEVLGKADDAKKYNELAEKIREAFFAAYIQDNGRIKGDIQSAYALSLAMDLVDDPALRDAAVVRLVEKVHEHNDRLTTGIHTTKYLLMTLSRNGHHDLAMKVVLNPHYPSYGYMVDEDATSIWERFDFWLEDKGFNSSPMNGPNHVGLSSLGQWMVEDVLGIQVDPRAPAFSEFSLTPKPGVGLSWAGGAVDSARGEIVSDWYVEDGQCIYTVEVPPNTTATLTLPVKSEKDIELDGKPVARTDGVERLKTEDVALRLTPGRYRFAFPLADGTLGN